MKKTWIIWSIALVLVLTGCKGADTQSTTPPATEPTLSPTVNIGGTELDREIETLDLTTMDYNLDTLVSVAPELQNVKTLELGCTTLDIAQVAQLSGVFPNADVNYTVAFNGQNLPKDTTSLDMSAMPIGQSAELARAVALLPLLQSIDFVDEKGKCVFDLETISQLDAIRLAAPYAKLEVNFQLFGKKVSSTDTEIKYYNTPIGNDGVKQLRAVLPYLTSCSYFLLDDCGIDNEVLAQLRSDFPQTKIVWRVWLCTPSSGMKNSYSYLTDTQLIRTLKVRDFNCQVLAYCNEVKYVDFGHNPFVSDFTFLGSMPELEVAIIALTSCGDLTPLANCPKLEYLEVFTSNVTDLSPLANCKELKHLNISNLAITDLTPLEGLTKLERLRIVMCDQISKEQIQQLQELLPDCQFLTAGWDPTGNGWRKDKNGVMIPRYRLLRQQMRYDYF